MSLSGTQNIQKQRSFQQLRFNPQRMSRTGFPLKALFALRFPGFWEWRIWGYTGHRHGKSQEHAKVRTETAGEEHGFPETRDSEGLPSHHPHALACWCLLQSWVSKDTKVKLPPRENSHWRNTDLQPPQMLTWPQGLQYEAQKWDWQVLQTWWEKMAGIEITLLIILGLLQSLQPLP